MSDEDIPRRGLLGKVLAALAPATVAASPPAKPASEPRATPRERDESGGLRKGTLREVQDPLARWRR
jgi:hypothetical protein